MLIEMKLKKLVIISHTEHYLNDDGKAVGWGPTVNEINYLADYFEEIVHIACLLNDKAPLSSNSYSKNNVKFVPISPFGGESIFDKLGIIKKVPKILKIISENIEFATHVQLRLPTGIGVFLLPYFSWFRKRTFVFWVKYAGNWAEEEPPIGYRFQRWFLVQNFAQCKVTINGFWPDQPSHCISFENPCLTNHQIEYGKKIAAIKIIEKPYRFVFVGRLEDSKGVQRIIEAFKFVNLDDVESIDFIGNGSKFEQYKFDACYLGDKVYFHGFLNNNQVHKFLEKAHFFLLPSTASEGFPKVIAEAACYGTIPIVSNVGSIGHYINNENGFVCKEQNIVSELADYLQKLYSLNPIDLKTKSKRTLEIANRFTFANYLNKLNKIV
jgi:glycosyltransferase involved in cell wall biosynthesis